MYSHVTFPAFVLRFIFYTGMLEEENRGERCSLRVVSHTRLTNALGLLTVELLSYRAPETGSYRGMLRRMLAFCMIQLQCSETR